MLNSPLPTRLVIEALEARITPAAFTVTTTTDSGPGSLRQAILDANALAGADTIGFAIPGDYLQVIALTSPLPAITDKVTISGRLLQSDQIRLDGTNAGPDALGLWITTNAANGTIIEQLQIANFSGSGVLVDGSAGVEIKNNQIFGNSLHGIHVKGGSAAKIYGNSLGADPSIEGSTGNKADGLLIENSTSNLVGISEAGASLQQGNTIRANGLFGIELRGGSDHFIAKNTITANGSLAPEIDQGGGIAVINSRSVVVGGGILDNSGGWVRNVVGNSITANRGNGVLIKGEGSVGTNLAGNEISQNLLGDGVRIDGAVSTQFGDVERGYYDWAQAMYEEMKGNAISQNAGWGIAVSNGASNTSVRANTLEGNGAGAILLDHVTNSTIGGNGVYYATGRFYHWITSGDGNTIQFGSGVGAMVKSSSGINIGGSFTGSGVGVIVESSSGVNIGGSYNGPSVGVMVKSSSGVGIGGSFTGAGIPIDLDGDGPTANDPRDTDTGANHLQNYPTLVVAGPQITASLATDAANTNFRIQIYAFDASRDTYTPFTSEEIKTDANGVATLTISSSTPISPTQKFFATATNLATGETSEFSAAATVQLTEIQPKISISSPATTTEGNTGVQNLSFTVTLDYATSLTVKVGYGSVDGNAKAGEDYGAAEGVLIFEPGETTKTITIPVFGDPIEEATESFSVQLTSVENGSFAKSSATGTITNDDGIPTISIQDVLTAEEADLGSLQNGYSTAKYTLTLSNPSLDPVTVYLSVTGGTATLNSDYSLANHTITFAPGTTSVTESFTIKNDTIREETETIQLQLSNPSAATLERANAVVSILDSDTWVIQAEPAQVVEGNDGQSMAVMKVRLVNSYGVTDHPHAISATFKTHDFYAKAGSDYVATEGTVTFDPGEFEKTISIPILGDRTVESDEAFMVAFPSSFGATLQQPSQGVTILNDDPGVISVAAASIVEGNNGQKMLLFEVSLSVPIPVAISFGFATQGDSAFEGVDFEPVSGQLTFAPGETQKTISVPIYGDRNVEQDETFTLKLTDGSGATVATTTGTIRNDDPVISIENLQIPEGQPATPGTRSVYLPVHLSQATDVPVTVDFATSNGTAEAPSDYIATSGTLTFAPGQTLKYIELQIMGDLTLEPDETFTVKLSNAQGAPLDTDTGVVTIKADEPFISAQNVTIIEGHSGTRSMLFTVSLSQAQSSRVTVDYATADGTATAGSDYTAVSGTLTFALGETTKTISVPILGDTLQEADETLHLLLSNVSGASLATADVLGVITNDDQPESLPVISVASVSGAEGHSGTSSLLFTFSLSKASSSPVSVHFATADGTATAGSDYTAGSGTLTFAPGETTRTILVPILADSVQEANETLHLLLSEVSGATLAQSEATGTILNDDASPDTAHLVISKGGRMATWTDSDGDQITLKATKPLLALSSFHFVSAAEGNGLMLQELDVTGQGTGASGALGLSFSAKKSATGDGLVHVGAIDASGRDLSTLSMPGRLGSILAGDTNLKTPGIGKLTVDSLGLDSATAQTGDGPLQSEVKGSIGSFTVKHDFTGANLTVSGGSVGSLVIGGSLAGTSAATPSGISIEKNLGTLRVGGDVNHANVIAGSGNQAGAHVDQVLVSGNWIASNLVVGAGAGPDGLYGTGDDEALQDSVSRIARITIRGAVDGTPEPENGGDHFGFVAGRIAAFQVGGQKLALTSKWRDSIEVGSTSDVIVQELSGRSRS